MALFTGTAGPDHFLGADNTVDLFRFDIANLQETDTIGGGAGAALDRLQFTTSGTAAASLMHHVSGIEVIILGVAGILLSLDDAVMAANGLASGLIVTGSAGADTVDAGSLGAGRAVVFQAGLGNDSFLGGGGNDTVQIAAAALTLQDTLAGGTGNDLLQIVSAGALMAAELAGVSGFERISLAAGGSLALNDAVVVANSGAARLVVNGAAGSEKVDATSLAAGRAVQFVAGAGNDGFAGGAGEDYVQIAASALTLQDTLAGGAGTDTLQLTAAGTLVATALAAVSGFERVILAAGTNLGLSDAVVTANGGAARLVVYGVAGNEKVNAAGLAAGRAVQFVTGSGNDSFAGGGGNDYVQIAAADLTTQDMLAGGGGTDILHLMAAGTLAASALAGVSGFEAIILAAGSSLSLSDGLVIANSGAARLSISGAAGNERIDGSSLTAGRAVQFVAGAGNDSFAGGAGNDVVQIAASALNAQDTLVGGAGADTLQLTAAGTLAASALAGAQGFETIMLAAGTIIALGDAVVAANGTGSLLMIAGSPGADSVDASTLGVGRAIGFQAGAGNDGFAGGAGNDFIQIAGASLDGGDSFGGGAGSDVLSLTSGAVLAASALAGLSGFERIAMAGATRLGLDDAVVDANAAGTWLYLTGSAGNDTIDAAGLGSGRAVLFQAGAGDDRFAGGAGNDHITGGDGSDSLGGGAGLDQAHFARAIGTYSFARPGDGSLQVDDGAGNIDVVEEDVEFLFFAGAFVDTRNRPAAPRIDGIDGDTGRSASDFVTSDTTLRISGTAQASMTIELFLDGISVGTTTSSGTGNWTLDHSATVLAEGSYVLTATASNIVLVSGNASAGITLTIDTTAPLPGAALADDTGISGSDLITSDGTLALTGVEAGALVEYSTDSAANWTTTFTAAEGLNSVQVRQTDEAGNVSAASLSFTLDTTDPAAPGVALSIDTGSSASDLVTSDGTLALTGIDTGARIEYSTDGGSNWTATFTASEGLNDGQARQVDEAGNLSAAASFTFILDTSDPAAPVAALVNDTGSSSSDLITSDGTLTLTSVEAGALVEYSTDGGASWATSFDAAEGINTVRLRQTDDAGNVSAVTTFSFTVDTTGPATTITGYSADTGDPGDRVTSDTTLVIGGATAAFAVVAVHDGATLLGTTVAAADGAWSFTTSLLDPGSHRFTATATDGAGNAGPAATALDVQIQRVIDLTGLAAPQGFIIQGDAPYDSAGRSVASAGDVNGDGFDDLIVGAPFGDDGGNTAGEAYVVFGGASGLGTVDLSGLTPAQGFVIQGDAANDRAGWSVASAGDVNGDGFDDLIVGAHYGDDGGSYAGEAYVVFGKASGFATVDLTGLTAAQGFIIQGDAAGDLAGFSVASAGDVNGDGFDDLIVGARDGDDGGSNAGEAYVVFGKASGIGTVDLTGLAAAQGFIIQGDAAGDVAGWSVASAGDVNGDGLDDVIVGAQGGDNGGTDAGEAYVVFGRASGFGTVDLSNLGVTRGFSIQGDTGSDAAGWSVASAGDVNGDGFDDVIVGARTGDDGGLNAGEAYVVFGKVSGFGTVDLTGLAASRGFIIQGDAASDQAGFSVASAGDVNGDGFDDLIVGAPYGDDGGANAGEAYVVFGKASGFGTINLAGLTAAQGFIVQGDAAGNRAGFSVASAGDVNADGFDDLIVGAPAGGDGGTNSGEAYVVLGAAFGRGSTPVTVTGTAAAEMLIGGLGHDTLTGGGGSDVFRGGAGNDVLALPSAGFRRIDGGAGIDTLGLDGSGVAFDFSTLGQSLVESIEVVDLTGSGNNSLTLGKLDLLAISGDTSGGLTTLIIHGDAGDSLVAMDSGWTNMGTTIIGGQQFALFRNGQAQLLADDGLILGGSLI